MKGTVAAGGTHIGDVIHHLHAVNDLPEYGVRKIQMEGAAHLGVLFGDGGGIFLYVLRQPDGLIIIEPGIHLVNVGLDFRCILQRLLHHLHPALGVVQQLIAGHLHRQCLHILGGRLAVLHDEELAAVGVGAGVGHAQGPAEIVQLPAALVLKLGAVNALAACAGAGGVAPLDHKILDDPVENKAVVVALFGQRHKVFNGFRGNLRVKPDGDIAHVGVHDGTGAVRLLFSFSST